MSVLLDKAVDGLFIFIGVFFAFHFDQYQQDLSSKRELDFNLTQVMRDLPEKPPPQKVARFEIEQTKNENGTCDIPINMYFESSGLGDEYLKLIKNRGLVKFVKDDRLIRKLTYYYDELIPKYKKEMERFYEFWQKAIINQYSVYSNRCLTEKELENLNSKIKPYYMRTRVADGFARTIGYDIYQTLEALGYKPPEKQTQRYEYSFKEVDPEELKKDNGEQESLTDRLRKKSSQKKSDPKQP